MTNKPEPPPKPNESRPIWELVIEDMQQRDHDGRAKYGTPLQAGNGRDALIDAYQEALDLTVYLRQAIEERVTQASMNKFRAEAIANGYCTRCLKIKPRPGYRTCDSCLKYVTEHKKS